MAVYLEGLHNPSCFTHIFECLLLTQLQRQILPHITPEQFGFMKGSSTSDPGVFPASTITIAINHQAKV